jgi:acyl carrier protein
MEDSEPDIPLPVDDKAVLADIRAMLVTVLDGTGLDGADVIGAEITMDTTFRDDLDLESIDLVALGGQLGERYGERVNFAEFVAELDLDAVIALTVGSLVDYVVTSLHGAEH